MKYIIYCRKSSEDESRQVQSLETQMTLLDDYSKKCGLIVLDRLQESRSAKNDNNRPLFNSMVQRIKNHEVEGILVAHIDRLSRNGTESALLIKLFEEGFLKEIRTPSRIYSSIQDLLYMDFDFVFAAHYSRNLSIRVKEGIQTKLKKGEYPGHAPLGYLNKDGKIYPNPETAPCIKRIFELYATGNYCYRDLAKKIFEEGYRSANGLRIRFTYFERVLKNKVYIGLIYHNGKTYKGIHEPIISQELFDQAQNINFNKTRPKSTKYEHLYGGFVRCDVCGCLYTTSIKVKKSGKKYVYYYCTDGKGICTQHKSYLRDTGIQALAQQIFDKISGLVDSEVAQLSLEAYIQSLKDESIVGEQTVTNIDTLISKNKVKQNKLLDLLLEEKIVQDVYDKKLFDLKVEEMELNKQKSSRKDINPESTLELLQNFKTEAISLSKVFLEGDDDVKRDLLNSVLWNFSVKDHKVANVRYKKLYEKLANMPKNANFAIWQPWMESIRTFYAQI